MVVPLQWYALAVATTLLNGLTFGFIAWRESNVVLRRWGYAWLAWGLAAAALAVLGASPPNPLVGVVCGLLWIVSALHFLGGAYGLAGRPMPRFWYAIAALCAAVALALGVGPNGAAGMAPLVLFQSIGLGSTAAILIRSARARAGAWLCGLALLALAVHLLDAPLLTQRPELFLWGFALAIALQIIAALGMLMLYYEHARAALVATERAMEGHRRMEALGRVAGGVAHDFNNMLAVIQGEIELIRLRGAPPSDLDDSLRSMDQAVQRARRLTAQLLAFGRRSVLQPEAIDVREVVASTLDLLRKVVPARIQLRFQCEPGPIVASMDQSLLEQILLNLVVNARDAITGQGRIVVELGRVEQPDRALRLSVTDDGVGMDEHVVTHIFEPFFTSKPQGRGTGLGLASVQGAVTQLGGRIHVESQPGKGSRFEVVLPWVEAPASSPASSLPPAAAGAKILVVDDDEGVRRITVRLLAQAGHQVDEAHDGVHALESLKRQAYDLVISDVVMPEMGGLDLFAQAEKLRPDTAFLLTSGYPFDGHVPARHQLLAKPFRQAELLDTVARLLAARASEPKAAP